MMMKLNLLISILLVITYSTALKASILVDKTMMEKGITYNLNYCLPSDFDASNEYPLIVAMHYCGGSAKEYRTALAGLCDSLKMIVVCPDNNTQQIPENQLNMLITAIDSSKIFYHIDTTKVYLTGMSCNGEYITRHGLKSFYPFKGIFPWAPWMTSTSPKLYNYNCKIPIVMSVGNYDPNYNTIIAFYDSLKAHEANVNLLIVPNTGHSLFKDFSNQMINCIYYLNGTPDFSFEPINEIEITNNDSVLIDVNVKNPGNKNLIYSISVNNTTLITKTEIVPSDKDNQFKVKVVPNQKLKSKEKGKLIITLKAFDETNKEMSQGFSKVNITNIVATDVQTHQNRFSIYPVPVTDNIYFKSEEQFLTIEITDANGKEVFKGDNLDTHNGLQLQFLPKGFYFLSAKGTETAEKIKFIKR